MRRLLTTQGRHKDFKLTGANLQKCEIFTYCVIRIWCILAFFYKSSKLTGAIAPFDPLLPHPCRKTLKIEKTEIVNADAMHQQFTGNAPAAQLLCTCLAPATHLQCTCNAPVMHLQCTCNASAMHLQCICNAPAMHLQCTCNAPAMHLQCT